MQNTEVFFDRAPLHLLTTATLGELRRLQPDSVFDRARFRPNFVVNTDETGFVENDWVDKDLDLGAVKPLRLHYRSKKPVKDCSILISELT